MLLSMITASNAAGKDEVVVWEVISRGDDVLH